MIILLGLTRLGDISLIAGKAWLKPGIWGAIGETKQAFRFQEVLLSLNPVGRNMRFQLLHGC